MNTNTPKTDTCMDRGLGRTAIRANAERRAKTLALLGLGIGLAEVVAPGSLARTIGVRNTRKARSLLVAFGVRELATSVGLLARPQAGLVWARLAGDILDFGLLAHRLSRPGNNKARLAATACAVIGLAALDAGSAARLSRQRSLQKLAAPIHVVRSITVGRSPAEVYAFWRDLANLPRFMAHLESVLVQNGMSTWRAKAPAGASVEWQAEIVMDKPNEAIAWRSVEGTWVPNQGVVRFLPAPGGRGTQVLVELKYDPPGGVLTQAFAKLFGEEPGQQIASDLRRLKQVLEIGEVVHSDASIHRTMHAARPPEISTGKMTAFGKAYTS